MITDQEAMQEAFLLARRAQSEGEVPVGAVVVHDGAIIGRGWNQVVQLHDPNAHAETMALRDAGQQLSNYRLLDTTLYVTLEPCVMCMGTMMHARVKRIVFGATDPKTGALGGAVNIMELPHWNHKIDYTNGVMAQECGDILREFFKAKRQQN